MPFQNYDPVGDHIDNTGKILVALQPISPLHSDVYLITEANSSNPFNLLVRIKQNMSRRMNAMNYDKWIL